MRHRLGEAGGIDQYVGAAECLRDSSGEVANAVAFGERQLQRGMALAGQATNKLRGAFGAAVIADDDGRTFGGEHADGGGADAAAAAGHHRDFAGERRRRSRSRVIAWIGHA